MQEYSLHNKMSFAPSLYSFTGQYLNGKMSTLVQLQSLQVSGVFLSCRDALGVSDMHCENPRPG